MEDKNNDTDNRTLILQFLKELPQGGSIRDISLSLNLNRNLVSKYLSILHMQGRVELRSYGKVKIYRLSTRIPFHALSLVTQGCAIGLDQLLYVKEVLGNCLDIIGCDGCDLLFRPFSDLFHPILTDPVVRKYILGYRNGNNHEPLNKDIFWRNRGYHLSVIPCIFDDSTQGQALIISEIFNPDYAQKKQTEHVKLYEHLTRETPNFILYLSADGEVLYLNHSFSEYCGKDENDIIGTDGIPLASKNDFYMICDPFMKDPERNIPAVYDIQVVMKDGSVRWQRWIFHPIREQGVLTELHGYGMDITDEQEQHALFIRLQSEMNQIVREKTSDLRKITSRLRKEIDDRKVLEYALKKSKEKYQNLTEITTDIIWETDFFGNLVYINSQVNQILGYDPKDLIGKKIWFLINHDQKKKIENFFSKSQCTAFEQVSFQVVKSDGTRIWIDLSGIPLFDKDNNFSGFRGIGRDITKSVSAEEQNQRLLSIVENTPDIIRISNIHGKLLYINEAGRKLLKIPDDTDITSHFSSEYMMPEDWEKILEGRNIAIKKGRWQGITRLRATDGTFIPVSQVIIAHKTGNSDEMIFSTVARNICDIIQIQNKFEELYEYTRNLIEVNPDPLVTIGSDGRIQDVNHATEIATGYSRKELIGTDFCSYFSHPEKAREGYEYVFLQGYVRDYPLEMKHRDGNITPVLYNASIYQNKNGKILGVFATAREITNLKGIQNNLSDL